MDFVYEIVTIGIPIAVSIAAFIISWYAYGVSKRQLHQPALEYLRRDYRSPEMMLALHNIWSFYRISKSKSDNQGKNLDEIISEDYTQIVKGEELRIDVEEDYDKKMNLIKNSLSYQRRLVITFYYYLYEIWKYEILTPTMIFEFWDKSNMDIFDILKPIERVQAIIYLDKDDKTKEYKKTTEKSLKKLDELRKAAKEYSPI